MPIPPQVAAFIGNLASEFTSQTAEKIAEKYGEEAARWVGELALERADVLLDLLGDQVLDRAGSAASAAANKFTEVTGLTAAGIIGQAGGEKVGQAIAEALEDLPLADLAPVGAQIREAAGRSAAQLRHLTDEQVGALAVLLARSGPDSLSLVGRLREKYWRRQ